MKMKVSIAMATYNGEKYLREQLDSILAQTETDWELIISDDGSTDSTVKIAQEYAEKDSRICIVKNTSSHGCSENFENALRYCKGGYIAFCDQDDVWTTDHLEHLLSIIGDKSLAFADAEAVDSSLKSLNFFLGEKFLITEEHLENNLLLHLIFLNFVQGTAVLFKRELLNFLPFPNGLFHDHWAAISAVLNDGIAYSNKSILKYRQHGNNTCGVLNHSFFYKIKNLRSEGIRRIHFYYAISDFIQKHFDSLSEKMKSYSQECLNISHQIIFHRSFSLFRKYYDVIFWDSNRKKIFSRYLMYCIFFPFFRARKTYTLKVNQK